MSDTCISSIIKNIYCAGARNQNRTKVYFEKIPFYYQIAEIKSPTCLKENHGVQTMQRTFFYFAITPEQIGIIKDGIQPTKDGFKYSKQIHLRFGCYENNNDIKIRDNLPINLSIFVNGSSAQLPEFKSSSTIDSIQRVAKSIDITYLCHLAPSSSNKIDISWKLTDTKKRFYVGIYIFKKLSLNYLVKHLKENTNRLKEKSFTQNLLIEQLKNESIDLEVETNALKVKLVCPLMKTRMKLPGRSIKCKHVQCFDIENYLLMNEKKSTWLCPICDLRTTYDNLIIDELHLEILDKCLDENEIEINSDGTWDKVKKNQTILEVDEYENSSDIIILNDSNNNNANNNQNNIIYLSDDEDCVITEVKSSFDLLKDIAESKLNKLNQLFKPMN